ncbi:MAG: bifunctional acetate--CoA ligase family protein/GNAT family N-acetyltransferase [Gammaproteobacteria bacterium]|nr:bifunctional acetate--CoA ligase family protein/GNAT family N-acetyltransferase [Gammaproteobacteria bacterium]
MSIRNLNHLLKPKSVALIGASKTPGSVGAVLARNLFKSGFDGPVMPVNPRHQAIEGVLTYPDIESLPVAPDLVVVSTPPDSVPGIIAAAAARGSRAAVVITAGFAELADTRGATLQQALLDAARPSLLRVVGPNCVGLMVPGLGLNASFAHLSPRPGTVAFVAQSGAVLTSVIDWAETRGIGFSHLVSLGDMCDVDFGDLLDYLANDPGTRAILLYIEAVSDARKFMSAGRAAARMKPVIVVKAGRHAEGARAAASHTGALAGSDAIYDAAFRRAGMLRVVGLDELFDAVETLARGASPAGDRLAILTNGGGMGVMATDALIDAGGHLAELSEQSLQRLDAVLPPTWSRANPVDIIGDADGARYQAALEVLLEDDNADALLVLNCPVAVASSADAADAVAQTLARHPRRTLLTSWVGDHTAIESRRRLAERRIPTYETPTQAVRAFMHMVNYRRNQELLMETPASIPEQFVPDLGQARAVMDKALAEQREWLSEPEAKAVLAAYHVPVTETRIAGDAQQAAQLASRIGGMVALKILSPDILHKSDVGGVALDLPGPAAVRDAAESMLARIRAQLPQARIEGFSVQPMFSRPGSFELLLGVTCDARFGPCILFGQGGTAVELVDDKALSLPPLNMHLARELVSRTRVWRLLKGYRNRPPASIDAIALTLVKISQLIVDLDEVVELDINPLLADEYGVIALDARIRLAPASGTQGSRLAIRPYPRELEERIELADGRVLLLRPVLPEDEPALRAGFARLTPEEVRLRFFVPMKTLGHVQAARFTQIDYDREMALVITDPGIAGESEIYGVVRISADSDNERAEYAVIVRGDMTGMGLGILLMRRIIDHARKRGIGEIFGDVLRENTTMLRLCEFLGFSRSLPPDDPGVVRVTLKLRE